MCLKFTEFKDAASLKYKIWTLCSVSTHWHQWEHFVLFCFFLIIIKHSICALNYSLLSRSSAVSRKSREASRTSSLDGIVIRQTTPFQSINIGHHCVLFASRRLAVTKCFPISRLLLSISGSSGHFVPRRIVQTFKQKWIAFLDEGNLRNPLRIWMTW